MSLEEFPPDVTFHSPVITSRFPSGVVIQVTKSVARGDHKRKNVAHRGWIAVELYYHSLFLVDKKISKYKPLREQLKDGDINSIPDEYKKLCPFPEKCTAYIDLVKVA